MDKEYRADFRLGTVTDTWDTEGRVLEKNENTSIEKEKLEAVLGSLTGDFCQIPPVFSAKKIAGKPSYRYARDRSVNPADIILKPVRVKIYEITLESFSGADATIRLKCSSGTYVRSVVYETGKIIGCGATLTGLSRNGIGSFNIRDSLRFEKLEEMPEIKTGKPEMTEIFGRSIISCDDLNM